MGGGGDGTILLKFLTKIETFLCFSIMNNKNILKKLKIIFG
jgi:hypothetical protein